MDKEIQAQVPTSYEFVCLYQIDNYSNTQQSTQTWTQ